MSVSDEQVQAALIAFGFPADEVQHEPNRGLMRRALEAAEATAEAEAKQRLKHYEHSMEFRGLVDRLEDRLLELGEQHFAQKDK